MVDRWAGESSRCEDPAPTVGIAGHIATGHHLRPTGINGYGVKAKKRRGTPRRYVLREMGE